MPPAPSGRWMPGRPCIRPPRGDDLGRVRAGGGPDRRWPATRPRGRRRRRRATMRSPAWTAEVVEVDADGAAAAGGRPAAQLEPVAGDELDPAVGERRHAQLGPGEVHEHADRPVLVARCTRRTRSTSASWVAGSPCDRLMRITSAPAAISLRRTGSSHEAGPRDATILVRRTACAFLQLTSRACPPPAVAVLRPARSTTAHGSEVTSTAQGFGQRVHACARW